MLSRYASSPLFTTWIVPGAIYLALATGAGNPIRCHESRCDYTVEYLSIAGLLLLLLPFLRGTKQVASQLLFFGGALSAVVLYGAASPLPAFIYGKAFGAFIASGFVLVFATHLLVTGGAAALAKGVSRVMTAVLVATIILKAPDALFDRDVPYLLNGPIVFGWLMGLGAICAFYIALNERTAYVKLIAFFLAIGVLWSGSKGPIIAYAISAFALYMTCGGNLILKSIRVIAYIFAIMIAIQFIDARALLENTRFGLIFYVVDAGIDVTEGSVGVRAASYQSTLALIAENPLTGIGPGAFAEHEPDLMYPHNVHLEIFLEYGVLPFLLYCLMLMYALLCRGALARSLVLFCSVCLSFSGDLSYLRFLLPFLLLPVVTPPWHKKIAESVNSIPNYRANEKVC